MSLRDTTGYAGLGRMKGRGFGYCGSDFHKGNNCGKGHRHNRCAAVSSIAGGFYQRPFHQPYFAQDSIALEEVEFLKNQAEFLRKQLEDAENRINILEKEVEKERVE